MAPAREPFRAVSINVTDASIGGGRHKVGELRILECTACYSLIHPVKSDQHFKVCPVRNRT